MTGKWKRPRDPTPAEIAIFAAAIRESWSEITHQKRAGRLAESEWLPPEVKALRSRVCPEE